MIIKLVTMFENEPHYLNVLRNYGPQFIQNCPNWACPLEIIFIGSLSSFMTVFVGIISCPRLLTNYSPQAYKLFRLTVDFCFLTICQFYMCTTIRAYFVTYGHSCCCLCVHVFVFVYLYLCELFIFYNSNLCICRRPCFQMYISVYIFVCYLLEIKNYYY